MDKLSKEIIDKIITYVDPLSNNLILPFGVEIEQNANRIKIIIQMMLEIYNKSVYNKKHDLIEVWIIISSLKYIKQHYNGSINIKNLCYSITDYKYYKQNELFSSIIEYIIKNSTHRHFLHVIKQHDLKKYMIIKSITLSNIYPLEPINEHGIENNIDIVNKCKQVWLVEKSILDLENIRIDHNSLMKKKTIESVHTNFNTFLKGKRFHTSKLFYSLELYELLSDIVVQIVNNVNDDTELIFFNRHNNTYYVNISNMWKMYNYKEIVFYIQDILIDYMNMKSIYINKCINCDKINYKNKIITHYTTLIDILKNKENILQIAYNELPKTSMLGKFVDFNEFERYVIHFNNGYLNLRNKTFNKRNTYISNNYITKTIDYDFIEYDELNKDIYTEVKNLFKNIIPNNQDRTFLLNYMYLSLFKDKIVKCIKYNKYMNNSISADTIIHNLCFQQYSHSTIGKNIRSRSYKQRNIDRIYRTLIIEGFPSEHVRYLKTYTQKLDNGDDEINEQEINMDICKSPNLIINIGEGFIPVYTLYTEIFKHGILQRYNSINQDEIQNTLDKFKGDNSIQYKNAYIRLLIENYDKNFDEETIIKSKYKNHLHIMSVNNQIIDCINELYTFTDNLNDRVSVDELIKDINDTFNKSFKKSQVTYILVDLKLVNHYSIRNDSNLNIYQKNFRKKDNTIALFSKIKKKI